MNPIQPLFILLLILFVPFVACNSNSSPGPNEPTTVADTLANIPAAVESIIRISGPIDNLPGDTAGTNTYTFFDLESGAIVSDSLSADWDIGFSRTTIIANSGNGGGLQIVEAKYADVLEAPTENYVATTAEASASWYNYNAATFTIEVLEDRTIFVRTPDGQYAKIEIDSYYHSETNESRYFTFFYTLQTSGSTNLSNIVYYDIDNLEIVEDASSSQWDIAFGATTIFANSENNGGILALNTPFKDVDEAPLAGYQAQNSSWYTYTGTTPPIHAILPIENITLVLKTPDGKYAKLKVLSYYLGNPDTSTEDFANLIRPESSYYTIQYAYKTDGSRFFDN